MDPLSLTVNIITLLDTGQKIINLLRDIKDAPAEISKFLLEAQSSCIVLWRLKDYISRFESDSSSAGQAPLDAFNSLLQSDNVLGQYQTTLEGIHEKLEECSTTKNFQKLRQLATWKTDKADLEKGFQRLDRLRGTIELFMASETLARTVSHGNTLRAIKQNTTTIIESQISSEEEAKKTTILDWVEQRSNRYDTLQRDHYGRAQPGTGRWFLESEPFQRWTSGTSKTLFCPGMPGSGKTIIASVTTDYLRSHFPPQDSNVAFIHEKIRLEKVVVEFYDKHARVEPCVGDITALLQHLMGLAPRTFIILDALDELSNEVGANGCKGLLNCVTQLQATAATDAGNQQGHQLRLLVTARPGTELTASFHPDTTIQIHSAAEDIRLYLEKRVEDLDELPEVDDDGNEADMLRIRIVNRILEAADGLFLLASLHADSLRDAFTVEKVFETLDAMSTGQDAMSKTYEATLHRINAQSIQRRELAQSAIGWILQSQRALTPIELRHAVAIRPDVFKDPKGNVPTLKIILAVCLGLVTVDLETNVVRLVHYTVQEHLAKVDVRAFAPIPVNTLARSCLTYLLVPPLHDTVVKMYEDWESSLTLTSPGEGDLHSHGGLPDLPLVDSQRWPFLLYAREYWSFHYLRGTTAPTDESLAMEFLTNERALATYWHPDHETFEHGMWVDRAGWVSMGFFTVQCRLRKPGPVSVASRWGLDSLVVTLLNGGHDCHGLRAYSMGIQDYENGRRSRDQTRDDDNDDWYDHHPLVLSARHGHLSTARILLKRCKDLGDAFERAVCTALKHNHALILELLVHHKTRSNLVLKALAHADKFSLLKEKRIMQALTANHSLSVGPVDFWWLPFAEDPRCLAWVEFLLHHYVPSENSWQKHLFFELVDTVTYDGCQIDYRALPEVSGSPDASFEAYHTALWHTVWHKQHQSLVSIAEQLLVTNFAEEQRRRLFQAAFHTTVWRMDLEIVQTLLGIEDIDVNAMDGGGQTWLTKIFRTGLSSETPLQVIKLVLGHERCDPDATDIEGRTPLSHAVQRFSQFDDKLVDIRMSAVESLLQFIPALDPDRPDHSGRTPLSWAAGSKHNRPAICRLLSLPGVQASSVDCRGRSPLSYSAQHGDLESFTMLLPVTDPRQLDNPDVEGRTPFFYAVLDGNVEKLHLLMASVTIDVGQTDIAGVRPLSAILEDPFRRADALVALLSSPTFSFATEHHTPLEVMFALGGWHRLNRWYDNYRERALQSVQALRNAAPSYNINERCSKTGLTAASHAAKEKHPAVMASILEVWGNLADLSIKDNAGFTAVDYAMETDRDETFEMFAKWPDSFRVDAARLCDEIARSKA
ncbi:uncharacterized protein B0I36DRAFT_366377 [Microdochium trichocladiopsis]|uniref:NACHT domain-containing protein n=1 Tax=Microdochium trichocladiopsis TaxID=1682393 RepID=A0A9P9BL02_9PEZI|nr:uncharacterized protein B0I36DRAFT_366377 [Microdochium trichocladiopsis]KAH7024432.1 hypothetical protein B0I36DRAFT_366377 [Microdochium trichocladiopsis]